MKMGHKSSVVRNLKAIKMNWIYVRWSALKVPQWRGINAVYCALVVQLKIWRRGLARRSERPGAACVGMAASESRGNRGACPSGLAFLARPLARFEFPAAGQ